MARKSIQVSSVSANDQVFLADRYGVDAEGNLCLMMDDGSDVAIYAKGDWRWAHVIEEKEAGEYAMDGFATMKAMEKTAL